MNWWAVLESDQKRVRIMPGPGAEKYICQTGYDQNEKSLLLVMLSESTRLAGPCLRCRWRSCPLPTVQEISVVVE